MDTLALHRECDTSVGGQGFLYDVEKMSGSLSVYVIAHCPIFTGLVVAKAVLCNLGLKPVRCGHTNDSKIALFWATLWAPARKIIFFLQVEVTA